MATLTKSDLAHLAGIYRGILDDLDNYDGPECAMTSIGYVDVWSDGEVTANGDAVAKFDDDGDLDSDWMEENGFGESDDE